MCGETRLCVLPLGDRVRSFAVIVFRKVQCKRKEEDTKVMKLLTIKF